MLCESQKGFPCILAIGSSIVIDPTLHWIERKPLFAKRVLVTRALDQSASFEKKLRDRGCYPILFPTITITAPPDRSDLQKAIGTLNDYDWIAFTSANGVKFFFEELYATGKDARTLSSIQLAVIGPGTQEALRKYGLMADIQATQFQGEGLAEALLQASKQGNTFPPKVLLPRAGKAREAFPELIRAAGGHVDVVVAYETHKPPQSNAEQIREYLRDKKVDIVTVTSSSTVQNLAELLGPHAPELLRHSIVASIGPITTETAHKLGIQVDITAAEYSIEGLLQAMEVYFASRLKKAPLQLSIR